MSQALDRFVAILNVFTPQRPSASLAEVAAATRLDKSTAHRLLGALEGHRLVRRDPVTKRYSLGSTIMTWGALSFKSIDVRQAADPVMRRLHQAIDETVGLYVRDRNKRTCILSYDGTQAIRHVQPIGLSLPITRAAGGRLTLAHLPEPEARALLAADAGLTDEDRERILVELPEIRAKGWEFGVRQYTRQAWSLAAPIFNYDGELAATLVISGPVVRLADDTVPRLVELIIPAACEISQALGKRADLPANGHGRDDEL